jgi:hypothetical protein
VRKVGEKSRRKIRGNKSRKKVAEKSRGKKVAEKDTEKSCAISRARKFCGKSRKKVVQKVAVESSAENTDAETYWLGSFFRSLEVMPHPAAVAL